MLYLEPCQPFKLPRATQLRRGLLGDILEVPGMAILRLCRLFRSDPCGSVLEQRLQQVVSSLLSGGAQRLHKRLIHQLAERFQELILVIGPADGDSRSDGETTPEHRYLAK